MRWRAALVALMLAAGLPAQAVQPDEILPAPRLEQRARDISAGLRCLVCQNQSIDDSDAPLARDLRLLVRERLKGGASDDAVRDYLVLRYGEFVLLRPTMSAHTALLWGGPGLILALGAFGLLAAQRRRARPASVPLTAEEEAALARMLNPRGPV